MALRLTGQAAEPPVHYRRPDGYTACHMDSLRRCRRTTDRRKVTCPYCVAELGPA